MLIRRLQPDYATRVIPNLDRPAVERLDRCFDRRLIIGALDDLWRLPHMIVSVQNVNSITRHRSPPVSQGYANHSALKIMIAL